MAFFGKLLSQFCLCLAFLAIGSCTQQGPQLTPVEQLPNPETGKEKPQLFFIFDSNTAFWNIPQSIAIDSSLRTRSQVFVSSSPVELESQLREFNARSNEVLVIATDAMQGTADAVGVFKHPTRSRSLNVSPQNPQNFKWELTKTFALLKEFCDEPQNNIQCQWHPSLLKSLNKANLGEIPAFKKSPNAPTVTLSFDPSIEGDLLLLHWDWVAWVEQLLRDIKNSETLHNNAPWKVLSLENGNFTIELRQGSQGTLSPKLKQLQETLLDLRLKYLQ